MTAGYTLKRSFVPNFSTNYYVSFNLYTNEQIDEPWKFFKKEPFHIAHRILQDSRVPATGVITNENMDTIGHAGRLRYILAGNPEILLKSGTQYELMAEVKKGSSMLNKLGPTMVLVACYCLKGSYIPDLIRGRTALWFFAGGFCFLIAAGWQHLSDKKKRKNSKQQDSLPRV